MRISSFPVTRGSQEPNPLFLPGVVVHYSLIQCWRWLYRTEPPWVMRMDCIVSPQPPLLPHKVDDGVQLLTFHPLGRFYRSLLFQDLPRMLLKESHHPLLVCTHIGNWRICKSYLVLSFSFRQVVQDSPLPNTAAGVNWDVGATVFCDMMCGLLFPIQLTHALWSCLGLILDILFYIGISLHPQIKMERFYIIILLSYPVQEQCESPFISIIFAFFIVLSMYISICIYIRMYGSNIFLINFIL